MWSIEDNEAPNFFLADTTYRNLNPDVSKIHSMRVKAFSKDGSMNFIFILEFDSALFRHLFQNKIGIGNNTSGIKTTGITKEHPTFTIFMNDPRDAAIFIKAIHDFDQLDFLTIADLAKKLKIDSELEVEFTGFEFAALRAAEEKANEERKQAVAEETAPAIFKSLPSEIGKYIGSFLASAANSMSRVNRETRDLADKALNTELEKSNVEEPKNVEESKKGPTA